MAEEEQGRVGGPVPVGWREGALARAKELEALCGWVLANNPREDCNALAKAIPHHLDAARQAAKAARLDPKQRFCLFRDAALLERARCNLAAAETNLLSIAPPEYVLGPSDPRRRELERIAQTLGVTDVDSAPLPNAGTQEPEDRIRIVKEERAKIVSAKRGASSASLREQVRVRSFRNVIVVTTVLMTLLAIAVAIAGWARPTMIPLCFAPEEAGQAVVVCPTRQSERFPTITVPSAGAGGATGQPGTPPRDIDDYVGDTATTSSPSN